MLKVSKKVLVLCVVFALMFSAFVGCQAKTTGSGDKDSSKTAGTSNTGDKAPAEDFDFQGRTLTFHSWGTPEPEAGSPSGDEMIARDADLQKKYNFKLEFIQVPQEEVSEKLTSSVLAGEPYADIISTTYAYLYPGYVKKGFLLPLNDLFDFSQDKWETMTNTVTTIEGKTYGMNLGNTWYPRSMVFFNKTMMEREGMPNLYELQKNKQWTWAKFEEVCKALTKDTDGDGVIDQWGVSAQTLHESAIYSNGGIPVKINDDGTADFGFDNPEAIEALDFYQKIATVDKSLFIKQGGDAWDRNITIFQEGKTGFFVYSYWPIEGFVNNMKDDYGLLHFPMGPRATKYSSCVDTLPFWGMPTGVKDPEQVAMIFDLWSEPTQEELANPDSWKTGYSRNLRDSESLDTLWQMWTENRIVINNFGNFADVQPLWWNAASAMMNGEKTPAQVMAEVGPAIQAGIEDALKQ